MSQICECINPEFKDNRCGLIKIGCPVHDRPATAGKWIDLNYWMDRVANLQRIRTRDSNQGPGRWLIISAYNWRRLRASVAQHSMGMAWIAPDPTRPPGFMGLDIAITPVEDDILEVR